MLAFIVGISTLLHLGSILCNAGDGKAIISVAASGHVCTWSWQGGFQQGQALAQVAELRLFGAHISGCGQPAARRRPAEVLCAAASTDVAVMGCSNGSCCMIQLVRIAWPCLVAVSVCMVCKVCWLRSPDPAGFADTVPENIHGYV